MLSSYDRWLLPQDPPVWIDQGAAADYFYDLARDQKMEDESGAYELEKAEQARKDADDERDQDPSNL